MHEPLAIGFPVCGRAASLSVREYANRQNLSCKEKSGRRSDGAVVARRAALAAPCDSRLRKLSGCMWALLLVSRSRITSGSLRTEERDCIRVVVGCRRLQGVVWQASLVHRPLRSLPILYVPLVARVMALQCGYVCTSLGWIVVLLNICSDHRRILPSP